MLLDQETLRFVFGMKLRALRLDKGLSLKELSRRTDLSPSYLNEIEKGKKYPKTEKILILAKALNESYEELVSLELKKDLHLVQSLLDKKFLTGVPFDLFGIPAATVFELLAERPKKMRALVGTLLEIARSHQIDTDDFHFALLRSYLDMHENHFPHLEAAAREFAVKHDFAWSAPPETLKEQLIRILKTLKVDAQEQDLGEISPEFSELSWLTTDKGRRFRFSRTLSVREQVFILAREAGHRALKSKTRPRSSLIRHLESFHELFNHFAANYFASSLLIPEIEFTQDVRQWLSLPEWSPSELERLFDKYASPPESLFHRLTQILPSRFGLTHLFFLRYEYDLRLHRYEIARELHLTQTPGPRRFKGGYEHYCSRWLIHRLTRRQQEINDLPAEGRPSSPTLGIQRSRYAGTENEHLIISMALPSDRGEAKINSVCIGILADGSLRKKIPWAFSEGVPALIVGETCERCPVSDCGDRQAAMDPRLDPERFDRIFKALDQMS